jgi:predicted RNA-binding Zn-ribbon protein involved in translation (DUF1610 family)
MATFETVCYFPGLCQSCRGVVQMDLLAKEGQCPDCEARDVIPYDDARLSQAPGRHVVAEWRMQEQLGRNLVLTDGNYKCPSCGMVSLRFSNDRLCWD